MGAITAAAKTAIGNPANQALNQRFKYSLSIPVLMKVITSVMITLIPSPMMAVNIMSDFFTNFFIWVI